MIVKTCPARPEWQGRFLLRKMRVCANLCGHGKKETDQIQGKRHFNVFDILVMMTMIMVMHLLIG